MIKILKGNRLTDKLVTGILLFSSSITLLLTVAQLTGKYLTGTKEISKGLKLIITRHNDTIARSLWTIDKRQLQIELQAIVFLKYVQRIIIYDELGREFASVGSVPSSEKFIYNSDLIYGRETPKKVGSIEIVGSDNELLASIWSSLTETLVLNLTKTILVSLFLFIFFHNVVLKRLGRLHVEIRKLPLNSKETEKKPSTLANLEGDELDELIAKFLTTNKSLKKAWAESEKKQNELEKANRTKSSFLAMVSHELRTPLNTIINTAALRLSEKEIQKEEIASLKIMQSSGEHMLRLINDIIDFVSYQKEVPAVHLEPLQMEDVFDGVSSIFQHRANDQGISLSFRVEPTPFPTLVFDRIRINQIIFNLVENALRFTKEGGIFLRVSIVESLDSEWKERIKGNESKIKIVAISIVDTGPGISKDVLEKINRPFYQLQGSIRRTHSGLDLGLSIVHRLVSTLNGTIKVDSTLGKGSKFNILLPMRIATNEEEQTSLNPENAFQIPEATNKFKSLSVLVTDDDDSARKIACMLLKKIGFKDISVATGGKEAFEMMTKRQFDIILLDIQMPDIDGWEVAKSFAASIMRSKSKVIALTAMSEQQFWEKSETGEFDLLLSKPVKAKLLNRTLSKLVDPQT